MRNTQQQRAIRTALASAGRPLGPEEILKAARPESPGLGLATVYRGIQRLLLEGSIQRVQLAGLSDRFEWTREPAHRHYFLCRSCFRLFELETCPDGIERLAPSGFRTEGHELTIHGLCPECQETK